MARSPSSPSSFDWPHESAETTHLSVVDADHNAVAMTYTLEETYGVKIVVPGAGFLLNNEMGDFNLIPGHTDATGKIGTPANLIAGGKRMLSSQSPTIALKRAINSGESGGGWTMFISVSYVIRALPRHGAAGR